jgi:quinol monooxygenase YgiN
LEAKLNTHIAWLLEVQIKEANSFSTLMAEMITATRIEKGTLAYEWHFNADNTACAIYERYESDDAVMVHLGSFSSFAERFLDACNPTSFVVFGNPSPTVHQALLSFTPKYWSRAVGFNKLN